MPLAHKCAHMHMRALSGSVRDLTQERSRFTGQALLHICIRLQNIMLLLATGGPLLPSRGGARRGHPWWSAGRIQIGVAEFELAQAHWRGLSSYRRRGGQGRQPCHVICYGLKEPPHACSCIKAHEDNYTALRSERSWAEEIVRRHNQQCGRDRQHAPSFADVANILGVPKRGPLSCLA